MWLPEMQFGFVFASNAGKYSGCVRKDMLLCGFIEDNACADLKGTFYEKIKLAIQELVLILLLPSIHYRKY